MRSLRFPDLKLALVPGLCLGLWIPLAACGPAADPDSESSAAVAPPVHTLYAVDTLGRLLSFRTESPYPVTAIGGISGLRPSESILGITFSPEKELYGLGSTSRLYRIDKTTATATQIGSAPFTPGLSGSLFGFTFNPHTYEIRVTSDTGSNFRLNIHDGSVIASSATLAYAAGDVNEGDTPRLAVSTSSCDCNLRTPTLYGIDLAAGTLVTVGNFEGAPVGADSGTLFTVGSLGVALDPGLGPIALTLPKHSPTAYAAIPAAGGITRLHRIELADGRATLLGTVPGTGPIRSLSVLP